jgi:hypothetical protein
LYGKEEEGKLFLILMYIKLPMYLKQCRMGGERGGGGEGEGEVVSYTQLQQKPHNIRKIKYRKFMYIKLSIYLNSKLTY